jgi:hypothetical protein
MHGHCIYVSRDAAHLQRKKEPVYYINKGPGISAIYGNWWSNHPWHIASIRMAE